MRIPAIETERLSIRGFEPADAPFAVSIWNDPVMGEYLLDEPMNMKHIDENYLKKIETLGEDETCCYLIAVSKKTGERVGTCSFIPKQEGRVFDIAYCVHRDFWQNGFATEMVGGLIDYAKRQGVDEITAVVSSENQASIAVMRKFGFAVAETLTEKKRGCDRVFTDYRFELELYTPDAETIKAIEDMENGIGLSRGFTSVKELMEDLYSDD